MAAVVAFASGAAATTNDGSDPSPEDVQAVFVKLGFTPKLTDRTYRIPSSSMETTFHCARPFAGCEASTSDRIIVREYGKTLPSRGDIVAFLTPPLAKIRCGAGGTFVQRIVGMPGDSIQVRVRLGNGWAYVNGKPVKEPYIHSPDQQACRELAR